MTILKNVNKSLKDVSRSVTS